MRERERESERESQSNVFAIRGFITISTRRDNTTYRKTSTKSVNNHVASLPLFIILFVVTVG